ncbi:hypothetical protein ASPCADRAFT_506400 [Aspergillus carbonarius ITEM 5010]|uniref:Photolyase/cryptochrome alpha/beta domain-containing protein n=1 Tax=Aspergillus carbonarius (strain ITEM 5010) TaxID=602072 RepID=A0A1R3RQP2_ASPC5|nr:hypothetical protein ASPCADRAFT_506400 [Aspergillus carbonarius ITEM 5010]
MPPNGPIVLFWHRTDLRLHDNPALKAALDLKPSIFIPIFTWDPHYVYRARVGPNRWQFLIECQNDLSTSYSKLNAKQKLWIVRDAPQTILPKLWKAWNITHLVFAKETDAYARDRDDEVVQLAEKAGVKVIIRNGRTLFDPDEVVRWNHGEPPMSITQLQKATEKINDGIPDQPVDPPSRIPDPWADDQMNLRTLDHDPPTACPDLNAIHRTQTNTQFQHLAGPQHSFAIPALSDLGIDPAQATTPHHGGESRALQALTSYLHDSEYISTFEKPHTSPAAFSPPSTTLLSPHLHFGSLSVRKFYWDVHNVLSHRQAHHHHQPISHPPTNLPGQLLFREMFFAAQAALGHTYAHTRGNKIARFIPWHLQSNYYPPNGTTDGTYTIDDPIAETYFRRWKHGQTGFPWIDALMRQLRQEDEPASNLGNWMWLSCTAFFAQYHRCYSPIAFGKKWDPEGRFVRRYCPELRHFDKKVIYEPWKASVEEQREWGCLIRGDGREGKGEGEREEGLAVYPEPMFDFDERREVCLAKMKEAYEVGLHGDDEKVMDGSWKGVFGFEVKDGRVRDEMDGNGEDHSNNGKRGRGEDGNQQEHPTKKRK